VILARILNRAGAKPRWRPRFGAAQAPLECIAFLEPVGHEPKVCSSIFKRPKARMRSVFGFEDLNGRIRAITEEEAPPTKQVQRPARIQTTVSICLTPFQKNLALVLRFALDWCETYGWDVGTLWTWSGHVASVAYPMRCSYQTTLPREFDQHGPHIHTPTTQSIELAKKSLWSAPLRGLWGEPVVFAVLEAMNYLPRPCKSNWAHQHWNVAFLVHKSLAQPLPRTLRSERSTATD
jgi:hypothetical protein